MREATRGLRVDLVVRLMSDDTYLVRINVGGIEFFHEAGSSEADAMRTANEVQGVLEMAGLKFDGQLTPPISPTPDQPPPGETNG